MIISIAYLYYKKYKKNLYEINKSISECNFNNFTTFTFRLLWSVV